MIYVTRADGVTYFMEKNFRDYSLAVDNEARKEIIDYFLNEKNAKEVYIETTADEVRGYHEAAKAFYDLALEWIETERSFGKWKEPQMIIASQYFMRLYIAALNLPEIEIMEDYSPDEEPPEIKEIHKKAHPIDMDEEDRWYGDVFDPTAEKGNKYRFDEVVNNDLIDDIADIYADLIKGMKPYQNGTICEALWQWKFNFRIHTSMHVTNAVRAICWKYEHWLQNKKDEELDHIYDEAMPDWEYENKHHIILP